MDVHAGGGGSGAGGPGKKLTRTPSSLLRSPTVRAAGPGAASSFHAFLDDPEPDNKKAQAPATKPRALLRLAHHRLRPGAAQSAPLLLLLLLLLPALALAALLLRGGGGSSHHLVLLAAAAGAALAAAAAVARHRGARAGAIRARTSPALAASVRWFIGEAEGEERQRQQQQHRARSKNWKAGRAAEEVREGVEFYSNGDRYEGEFHGGRCSGGGVYSFFGKGKYEGDWVDGKYDGYGVESWARGSRYRGQYRQGLRHGHGVYRFYSGDCYAGEWASGQSHGIGAQTCSDGSSYAGEFKGGVKHGLGSYHFR
jgi:hypothetical protein